MIRGLALVMMLAGCVRESRIGVQIGPAPVAPPSVVPAPAPGPAPGTAMPELVEVHAGLGGFCGRALDGGLWCWGSVAVPGEEMEVERARPVRLEGVPPLAGFTMAGTRAIVGWDREGVPVMIARDPFWRGDTTFAVHRALPVIPALPTGGTVPAAEPRAPKIIGGAGSCVVTAEHELWCSRSFWEGVYGTPRFARVPGPPVASAGVGPCSVGVDGSAVVDNLDAFSAMTVGERGLVVPARSAAVVPELGRVSAVACFYEKDRYQACGIGEGNEVRCTSARVQQRVAVLVGGHRATAFIGTKPDLTCVLRDDGQARCLVHNEKQPHFAALASSLEGLDARRGVEANHDVMCALDGAGVARCWGELGNPALGDGSARTLPAPVHLVAFDGADLLSSEGGITCARTTPRELRCFGRIGNARVDPAAAIPLPEPIDAMVGAFPLCVRGAASRRWYCRDPFGTFFRGDLPGGFAVLRDDQGREIGRDARSIAVDSGTGIVVTTAAGAAYRFWFAGTRQPLVFQKLDGWTGFPSHCRLTDAHEMWCEPRDGGTSERISDHVVAMSRTYSALRDDGTVFIPVTVTRTQRAWGFHPVAGLPAMAAIGDGCGLSRDHQVWCWGERSVTDEAYARLAPVPVGSAP